MRGGLTPPDTKIPLDGLFEAVNVGALGDSDWSGKMFEG